MSKRLYFNGINAATGEPLLPSIDAAALSGIICNVKRDQKTIDALRLWHEHIANAKSSLKRGADPTNLAQAGWGVIFPAKSNPLIREALEPLLAWRKEQAAKNKEHYFREFIGPDGYHSKESKLDFLTRNETTAGPPDPEKIPYYLLIVGDPGSISFDFQHQLDVEYAVGRIHFDSLEAYWNYANSVVAAEKMNLALPRKVTLFGVTNPDDLLTNLSSEHLIKPLADRLMKDRPTWDIQAILKDDATKERMGRVLGGTETPALLFTASHGVGFPSGHTDQINNQGALLCQDWPGPKNWHKPIPTDFYFTAGDISNDSNVFGLIACAHACYTAGSPKRDTISEMAFPGSGRIASRSFLARLPQRLLSHPKGGGLAVIGYARSTWGYSFAWDNIDQQQMAFEAMLRRLLEGHPVGSAAECFSRFHAEVSLKLAAELEEIDFGKKVEDLKLLGFWTTSNDARNITVIGDPAVRLMVKGENDD